MGYTSGEGTITLTMHMDASGHKRWLPVMILLGVVYLLAGITFGALAGWSASNQMRTAWRLAAWLTSAGAFAAHIWYEQFRLRNSRLTTALHASLAAALGAFGLAVAANLHAQWTASGNQRLLAFALALWPALTAVPAFVVALAVAAGLSRTRRLTKI